MIRENIGEFPFSNRTDFVWYFLIDFGTKETKDFYNVSGKVELIKELKKIINEGREENFSLFGVWPGQWRTDVFKMNVKEGYDELSKHFKSD
jgi:hypothetical protein